MSEPKQQPKILLHKPKKSQRSPPGVSHSTSSDGVGGARGVSTHPPIPPVPKQPIWYRFRTPLATLLVVNAVLIGYVLFRTKSTEPLEKAEKEVEEKPKKAEKEKEKAEREEKGEIVETKNESPKLSESGEVMETSKSEVPEPPKVTLAATIPPQQMSSQATSKPKLSIEEQQEIFKWMLAEKRKIKPTTKAEKAQIDAEKAVLKDFLRGKSALNL